MALLELKGFGVSHGAVSVSGIDLDVDKGTIVAIVGRGDGTTSLLALAVAGLLPRGATTEGSLNTSGKPVLYLDRDADAAAVATGAELIVADDPGIAGDPASQRAVLEALQQASRTAAVVIFTTDFPLALSMELDTMVIAGGKPVLRAPAVQISELPQHDAVRQLIGGDRVRTRTLMRPPIGEPILELDGVTRRVRRGLPWFGPKPVEVLRGVSFAVRQGEAVGVLGRSGAGKSALLRTIAGLDSPSAGKLRRRPGPVGYVFSDPRRAFNPTLPVGVSLTETLRVEETLLVEEQADRLVEVVRAVGLEPDILNALPEAFTTAELQRLALARALAGRPSLLLMDEPTATLDPAEEREFLVLLARVRADFGPTAIIASRNFEVLKAVVERVLVIDGGHIVEGGKPGDLADTPKQDVTRRLVGVRYPGPYQPPAEPDPVPVEPVPSDAVETAAPAEIAAIDRVLTETAAEPAVEPVAPAVVEATQHTEAKAEPAATASAVEEPAPAPESTGPVHGMSAKVVIAPVVLAEPVAARPVETEPEVEQPAGETAATDLTPDTPVEEPRSELTVVLEEAAAEAPVPEVVATKVAAPEGAPEATVAGSPEPEAAQATPEPSGEGADEAAETGKRKRSVGGDSDAARSVEGR